VRCEKKRLKKHEDVGSCVRFGIQVMAGKAGGRKLVSPADMNVWLMLEVVPGAVFNILQVLCLLLLTNFLFN
jgi:hypothetical protein